MAKATALRTVGVLSGVPEEAFTALGAARVVLASLAPEMLELVLLMMSKVKVVGSFEHSL